MKWPAMCMCPNWSDDQTYYNVWAITAIGGSILEKVTETVMNLNSTTTEQSILMSKNTHPIHFLCCCSWSFVSCQCSCFNGYEDAFKGKLKFFFSFSVIYMSKRTASLRILFVCGISWCSNVTNILLQSCQSRSWQNYTSTCSTSKTTKKEKHCNFVGTQSPDESYHKNSS